MKDNPRKRTLLYDEELPDIPDTQAAPLPRAPAGTGVTRLQENFLMHYLGRGLTPEASARAAGVPASRAYGVAHEWLRDARVKARKRELEAESLRRQNVDIDLMMKQIIIRATTPVTEAVGDLVVPPCRYCWGINNEYQRTHGEMVEDLNRWENTKAADKLPFDERGGDGYNYTAPPNPDCPNCQGQGDFRHPVHLPVDTRFMSPAGRMLLAGMKVGGGKGGGLEVMGRNQDAAAVQLLGIVRDIMELRQTEDGHQVLDLKPAGSATAQLREIRRVIVYPKGKGPET